MPRALIVPFTKMQGAGNDFVVLDNRFLHFTGDELAALAARVCPRRTGVGADGLLALDEPDAAADGHPAADFRMRYRNADGSLATTCGNGARCLARFAARAGLGRDAPDGSVALTFDTDGGRYTAVVADGPAGSRGASGSVRLSVPPPRGFADASGFDAPTVRIWTGTEHAVSFVESAAAVDLAQVGPRIRHDAQFAPEGANANVAEVVDRGAGGTAPRPARLTVRTFEKGVEGETLACGTGALAAALAARLTDRIDATAVDVAMPGGLLRVTFSLDGAAVSDLTLDGPAETVYEGTLEVR